MSDEDKKPQDGTNPDDEQPVDDEHPVDGDPDDDDDQDDDGEDVKALREQLAAAEEAKRQLTARAKKAEDDLKKSKVAPPTNKPADPVPTDIDERILLAQGMTEAVMDELKVVAKGRGVSLIEAQRDPLFVAAKERIEKEQKDIESRMPASRGSGQTKPKKDFRTPGLKREDHKKMFEQRVK